MRAGAAASPAHRGTAVPTPHSHRVPCVLRTRCGLHPRPQRSGLSTTVCQAAQTSAAPPTAPPPPPPSLPGGMPVLGHLLSFNFFTAFKDLEAAMRAQGARMMSVSALGRPDVILLRHPDDCAAVFRDTTLFTKEGTGWRRIERWLGRGLVSDPDPQHHGAVKEVLLPAFKAAAVRGFEPLFAQVGEELVETLLLEASAAGGGPIDVRDPCRRATLDVIGRAAFGYDFGALKWAAQRAKGGDGAAGGNEEDVIELYDAILIPAMLLLFQLPVPDALIPGHSGYVRGVERLEGVVEKVIAAKRAAGIGSVSGANGAAPTTPQGPNNSSSVGAGAGIGNGISSSSTGGGDILSFMLEAQAAGSAVIDDKCIRDQLNTFMLAGSDTTAATLAFALYELSRHPDIAAACTAEADAAFSALSPSSPSSLPSPTTDQPQQNANTAPPPSSFSAPAAFAARAPTIAAVVQETLRLYPAATEIARVATRDLTLGGHSIKKGSIVLPSAYSCQRNPDFWPQPDEFVPSRWFPENAATMAPFADRAWFPFAAGARACIGRAFALSELQVLLAVVLRRAKVTLASPGYEVETAQRFTLSTDGGTLVSLTPRE